MAVFTLNSRITIGNIKPFTGQVNDIVIKKSLKTALEMATIKIPTTARLMSSVSGNAGSVMTHTLFKKGDKVIIELGYNGELVQEFEGFVSKVNLTTPLEVECEGYAFQLRDKWIEKSWKKTTLKEVLQEIIKGTDIQLGEIDDVSLDKYVLKKNNAFKTLDDLCKDLAGSVSIWMDGKILHAGMKYWRFTTKNRNANADVVYKIGYNIVREGELKERRAGDEYKQVEMVHTKADGTKERVKVGKSNSNAEEKKIQAVSNRKDLERIATEKHNQDTAEQLEGSLTGFLVPMVKIGNKLKLIDTRYSERSGNYMVESVETSYGTNGARRKVDISFKL